MKKLIALLLGATIILSLTACGNHSSKPKGNEAAQIPNPFVNCDTLEDAANISGFDMTVPNSLDGYSNRSIQAIENEMIQVVYGDDDNNVVLRKATGADDVSGDYNKYAQTNVVTINNMSVTLKGNDNMVSVATWTHDGYSFAISINGKGLFADAVTDLAQAIG